MNLPNFVVGTGRCGSTMLSNMLRQHPSILSISEFFSFTVDMGGRISEAFPRDLISGEDFWQIIGSAKPRADLMVKHDVVIPEVIYPFESPGSRFSRETGIPTILQITLPYITEQHESLFDEIHDYAIARPAASIGEHYNHFFGWLKNKFNKNIWIERSGGIFVIIEKVFATFPNARFIHIVRDGRNAALSMSNHLGFRIFWLGEILRDRLGVDPYESKDRTNIDRVPRELQSFLPENFNRQAFLNYQLPLSAYGQLWSQQILNGLNILGQLPEARVVTIVYEDLLKNPQTSLQQLTEFLGREFINPTWIDRAAATVRQPRSSWQDLPYSDRNELIKACQPGFEALINAGIESSCWGNIAL